MTAKVGISDNVNMNKVQVYIYIFYSGIILEAYAPLGNPSRPSKKDTEPVVMDDPVIKEIAEKHGATAAQVYNLYSYHDRHLMVVYIQVCLAFPLHRGLMVLSKSVKPVRISENLKSTELKLDQEDMRRLRGVDKNFRLFGVRMQLYRASCIEA